MTVHEVYTFVSYLVIENPHNSLSEVAEAVQVVLISYSVVLVTFQFPMLPLGPNPLFPIYIVVKNSISLPW